MQNILSEDEKHAELKADINGIYKDVVIIGNGPSAIVVSYFLSGHWPYYKGCGHGLDYLHCRLMENKSTSLIEQNLELLCDGLEGRSNNPVSVLFDVLNHPEADLGINLPSVLHWVYDTEKAFDHVVLGSSLPGGSWQSMEGSILTISLGSWMELPNLSYKEWECLRHRDRATGNSLKQNRATVRSVAQYYYDYVQFQGLAKFFNNNARVTSIVKVKTNDDDDPSEEKALWKVQGIKMENGTENHFTYLAPYVVLATGGYDEPNTLSVRGEDLTFVLHSLSSLEYLVQSKQIDYQSDPILVVGAGLSAADAIITAHFYNIPTIHVFRRPVTDPELIFNKLPENMYPEYHKVHQMMQGKGEGYQGYRAYPCHRVIDIKSDHKVHLQGLLSSEIVQVSYVVVLVGSRPDLSFLPSKGLHLGVTPNEPINCRDNPINIDLFTHECIYEPNMFAVGPVVGDNFVRFLQGGALAITNYLHKKFHNNTKEENSDDQLIPD